MALIGTVKKIANNEFSGEIITLGIQAKNVCIVPESNRSGENTPSHRVHFGRMEAGAAWIKRTNDGREYLSLKLDDPSFTAPVFASLFEDADGKAHSLVWSRPSHRSGY